MKILEKVIDKHDHIKDNLNDIVGHLKKHKIKV
jgi:hypothetical protein